MFISAPGEKPYCRIRLEAEWEKGTTSDGNLNYTTYWIHSDEENPSEENKIPFKIEADPFYSEENMAHLRKAIKDLEDEKGIEHELIEVEE